MLVYNLVIYYVGETMEIEQLYKMSRQLNVLYVEDEKELVAKYELFLKKFFKSVDVAHDGKEGINRYIEYYNDNGSYYDIVISDIMMPIMDGISMSKEILEFNHQQQIIIVSAYNDSEKLHSLMDLGITYFILKPMNFEDIIKVLDKACSYIVRVKEESQKVKEMNQLILQLQKKFHKVEHDRVLYEHDLKSLTTLLDDYEISSVVDKDGIILSLNKQFEHTFKYSADELVGLSYKSIRDPEVSKKIEYAMKHEEVYRDEIKTQIANNIEQWVWTELIVVPVIDEDKSVRFHFIERDISEKKQADNLVKELSELQDVAFDFEGM